MYIFLTFLISSISFSFNFRYLAGVLLLGLGAFAATQVKNVRSYSKPLIGIQVSFCILIPLIIALTHQTFLPTIENGMQYIMSNTCNDVLKSILIKNQS